MFRAVLYSGPWWTAGTVKDDHNPAAMPRHVSVVALRGFGICMCSSIAFRQSQTRAATLTHGRMFTYTVLGSWSACRKPAPRVWPHSSCGLAVPHLSFVLLVASRQTVNVIGTLGHLVPTGAGEKALRRRLSKRPDLSHGALFSLISRDDGLRMEVLELCVCVSKLKTIDRLKPVCTLHIALHC